MVKTVINFKENSKMKKLLFIALMGLLISCTSTKKSSSNIQEDQFQITRKYIGTFLDYSHTGPQIVGGKDLIWIKTTIYTNFGRISAYGKKCEFSVGDKIYLKPLYSSPGNYGNWEYQIENDSLISYRVSEFRFENNFFTRMGSL
jgi:hypothetical protein